MAASSERSSALKNEHKADRRTPPSPWKPAEEGSREKTAQKRFAEELRKPAWDRALGMKIHRTAARHPARGLKLYPGNPLSF